MVTDTPPAPNSILHYFFPKNVQPWQSLECQLLICSLSRAHCLSQASSHKGNGHSSEFACDLSPSLSRHCNRKSKQYV
jgi:hypothetical protein